LVPVSTEDAGKAIRETPVDELRKQLKSKNRNPTGRKIRRDNWLAPLTLSPGMLSDEAEVHGDGLRASDKGFLQLNWGDYLSLLRWTAKQGIDGLAATVPAKLSGLLSSLGIDASMWRDLVWHFKKYFGRCSCVGSSVGMAADAERTGKRWHRGQKSARAFCLTT